jgi:Zn-dependent protease
VSDPYLADPGQSEPPNKKRGILGRIGGAIAAAIAVVAKFSGIAFALKFLAIGWTFILSLGLYVFAFGWTFAVVLMLSLLVHELGHYFAFRAYGLPARLPAFVPFLGAFTVGSTPEDPEHAGLIALAGPLAGLALAGVCFAIGTSEHDAFWLAAAYLGALLNAINLIPFPPMDGGRVAASIVKAQSSARLQLLAYYVLSAIALVGIVINTHGSMLQGMGYR